MANRREILPELLKLPARERWRGVRRRLLCHPDEASNASGWKDLGQLRISEAGTGF
jgi:hypothetical protein